jgi:hypothetical protein
MHKEEDVARHRFIQPNKRLERLETFFQTFGFNTVLLTVSKPSAGPAATEAVVTETANSLPTTTDSTLLSE